MKPAPQDSPNVALWKTGKKKWPWAKVKVTVWTECGEQWNIADISEAIAITLYENDLELCQGQGHTIIFLY